MGRRKERELMTDPVTQFLMTLEDAISDYGHACYRDGAAGSMYNENTENMRKLLSEHLKTMPSMPNDFDCSGLVYSAKEGKLVPIEKMKPWPEHKDAK